MTTLGSIAERQEFFKSEANLPCPFWDRAGSPLMTDDGWIAAVHHTVTPDLIRG
jgi:hypothetical protein